MDKRIKQMTWFFIFLSFPVVSPAQKDVTQFLDIPVDRFKPEMVVKLKSKGYTNSQYSEEILEGEFNGEQVQIFIETNNNKVWRIGIIDKYTKDETNIKIRFNTLIQQFANNSRYTKHADSIISKLTIPKGEDIPYEMAIHKKRYDASFYQKGFKYDSIVHERELLSTRMHELSKEELEKYLDLSAELIGIIESQLKKQVWFLIDEENYGEYRIIMFYENLYNKADGSGL